MTARTILATAILMTASAAVAADYAGYVDPFIGTGAVEGGLSGNNYLAQAS